MSSIALAVPAPKATTSPFRWPFLAVGRLPRPLLAVAWIAAALVLLMDCIGRIYMGEHWPTDVLGGLAVGLGWTSLALSVRLLSNPALARRK